MKNYYIYIITNDTNKVLYTGVTGDLERRVHEHKSKIIKGFSSKYNLNKLVYFEQGNNAYGAIAREKQIKGGSRVKKIVLIESINPYWRDLSKDWDC
ncbi:MAG: GIY-YIG nuclease family protein [bacterium]|nr:GIY-YIG nuclease family protein [bacterium]MDZ4286188.1 GIY-YIG nuclease family protein [Candidatus Sungbacteria bacterium]